MSINAKLACLAALTLANAAPSLADPQPWVINGTLVPDGRRPSVAAVIDPVGVATCTGVLVAPDVVLTAGHCVPPDAPPVAVVVGSNEAGEADDAGSEWIRVSLARRHPTADLAVLVLEHASAIAPTPIASGCAAGAIVDGGQATVAGFGARDVCGMAHDARLREATLTIDDARCAGCAEAQIPGRLDENLVTSSLNSSTCFGDSGGPLFLELAGGEEVVAGIVSAGEARADGAPCGARNLFVRPDAFLAWIEQETARTLPQATCAIARTAGPAPIVGGTPAGFGAWPEVALVALDEGFCTGVLAAPDVVLTAGHCLEHTEELPTVVVGEVSIDGLDGERVEAVKAVAHPDLDLAVIVLAHPARNAPARLASECIAESYLHAGAEAVMVGFGATDVCGFGDGYDGRLREGRLTISDPTCDSEGRDCRHPGAELIAEATDVNGCNGDSGGPLFLDTPDGLFLAGITNRTASDDPLVPACSGGGIYARIDAVEQWIEDQTGRRLNRASCETGDDESGGCTASGGPGGGLLALVGALWMVLTRRCGTRTASRAARRR